MLPRATFFFLLHFRTRKERENARASHNNNHFFPPTDARAMSNKRICKTIAPGKTVFIVKGLHNRTLLLATSGTTRVRFQSQTVDTVSSCFSVCNLDIHRAEFKENSLLEYHAHLKRYKFKI